MQIVFLGAGNLAFHLSRALKDVGHNIVQVYSRTIKSAGELANYLNCKAVTKLKEVSQSADLYIIAVSDDAIKELVGKLDVSKKNVVHTSGSISIDIMKDAGNYGVFYPLQTFSKNAVVSFREIPVCVEANNDYFRDILLKLANQISESVWKINSNERKYLHLSAVYACNFVNHMYCLAETIVNEKKLDFKILHPLIKETVNKAITISPQLAQTGPAIRNDQKTVEKHTNLLTLQPDLKKIYEIISQSIQQLHNVSSKNT